MEIAFKQICPTPILGEKSIADSEIWLADRVFQKGKYYLLLAPSGKGKSTFLHILMGIRKDFEGQLKINQEETKKWSAEQWLDLRRDHLAMVFQDLRLFSQLTALENIQLKASLHGIKTNQDIEEMSHQLGIFNCLDKKAGQLSYGQQQRVAIIRALCQPFSLLLLDEPFSHLDDENIEKARKMIEENCKLQGAGLLMVSLEADTNFVYDQTYYL